MDIINEITVVMNLCEDEAKKGNTAYFKTIIKILIEMKDTLANGSLNPKQQVLYSSGLTKIVLDNYSIAMSDLGMKILNISSLYAKYEAR